MFRLNYRRLVPLVALLAVMLLFAATASACPNCKEALAANDPEHSGVVKGYFYSILFMMGMPFAFLGCFSAYMYRQVLRARAERTQREQNDTDRALMSQREVL